MIKSAKQHATLNHDKISKSKRNIKQWANKREQNAKLSNDKIKTL
jgi:hypothetical protein